MARGRPEARRGIAVVPGAARFAGAALLAAAVLAAGCTRGGPPRPDGTAAGPALRAGDSLLDCLAAARLDRWSGVVLPAPVAALLGPTVLISTPIDDNDWRHGHHGQREVAALAAAGIPGLQLFRAPAQARWRQDDGEPEILREGRRQAAFRPGLDSFTGEALWFDGEDDLLIAVGPTPPRGIALRYRVLPDAFLRGLRRAAADPPTMPSALRQRVVVGETSRDALVLPAPGAVSFAVSRLDGEMVTVAVNVADHGCRVVDGALQAAAGQSDGVTFAVDVEALDGGAPAAARLWERHVPPGNAWVEAAVPLSGFRGRPVRLHLVTEPGPAANAAFDDAAWAELRVVGRPDGPPARPHVVLIDIDTLRADRLTCYAPGRATSPAIDAFASDGAAVFLDATSTASWTLPATVSMLTGLSPNQHATLERENAVPCDVPLLAETLRAAGYETRGLTAGGFLLPGFGFDAGFDSYTCRENWAPDAAEVESLLADRRSNRPLFLFVHTYMVHAPYACDPRFLDQAAKRSTLLGQAVGNDNVIDPVNGGALVLGDDDRRYVERLYEAGVARMDEALGPVLAAVERAVPRSRVLVLITSDHGEELFDHGELAHGRSLYEELLQVPLIVRFPDGQRAGRHTEPASLLDIVPTVLDVAGLPQPAHLPGLSLRRPLPPMRTRLAALDRQVMSASCGDLKLIRGAMPHGGAKDPVQLYDLASDPREQRNAATRRPEAVADLSRRLDGFLRQWPCLVSESAAASATDADSIEQLQRLGYVGAR